MVMNTRYKLAKGSQVREEDFGLLFYRMNGPRLYFISSGDLISPDFFQGDLTLEQWIMKKNKNSIGEEGISELRKSLDRLKEKGVIIEC
jgi:putative mycofactocin binding protein MftB